MRIAATTALLLCAVAFAQDDSPVIDDDTVGILSHIDIGLTLDASCVGPQLLECLPHVEIIDLSQFRWCQQNEDIGDCSIDYAYTVPYVTTDQTDAIERELREHWEWYWLEVIHVYNDHIWELPLCINLLAVCPDPGIDWSCLTQRLADALTEVLTELQPEYWRRVYESVLTHAPFALWYRLPYPALGDGGAIVIPVSGFEVRLDQYYDLVERGRDAADTARRGAYYFQDPLPGVRGVELPIPYTMEEIDALSGGIRAYEVEKVGLEVGTVLEQQHFGFGNVFEVWNEVGVEVHFLMLVGPYAPGWCTSIWPPYTGPTLTPMSAVVFPTNEATLGTAATPEGYGLQRVVGDPLLSP